MNGLQVIPQIVSLADASTNVETKMLSFDLQSLFEVGVQVVIVVALFYFLGKILFNPVREILTKRREEIATEYAEIEATQTTVNGLEAEYKGKLADIDKERTEILEKARKLALHQENKILKAAKEEAEQIKEIASLEIERERAAAKDDIRKEIIEVATLMASKFVESSIDNKTKDALLESTLNEMGESTWLN